MESYCSHCTGAATVTDCTRCPSGRVSSGEKAAGDDVGAACRLCPRGRGANDDNTKCMQCSFGHGTSNGTCVQCKTQLNSFSSAVRQYVIILGGKGMMASETEAGCVQCPSGRAGLYGVCSTCIDGLTSNADFTACEICPLGTAGTKGLCFKCDKGHRPNQGKTKCIPCPVGSHGQEVAECELCIEGLLNPTPQGECVQCKDGTFPDPVSDKCVSCPKGKAGNHGICIECPNGYASNMHFRDKCVPCKILILLNWYNEQQPIGPPGAYSTEGICKHCQKGRYATRPKTANCQVCPAGKFSVGHKQGSNGTVCLPTKCPVGDSARAGADSAVLSCSLPWSVCLFVGLH